MDFKNDSDLINRISKINDNKNEFIMTCLYENISMQHCHTLTNILNNKKTYDISKDFLYSIVDVLIKKESSIESFLDKLN